MRPKIADNRNCSLHVWKGPSEKKQMEGLRSQTGQHMSLKWHWIMGYELCYFSLVLAFCKCKKDDLGCEERRVKVFGGDESILNHLHFSNDFFCIFVLLLTFELSMFISSLEACTSKIWNTVLDAWRNWHGKSRRKSKKMPGKGVDLGCFFYLLG